MELSAAISHCVARARAARVLRQEHLAPFADMQHDGPGFEEHKALFLKDRPAESQVRTCLSREFAFLRREAAVSAGVRAGASGAVGRDARGAATSCLRAVISLSGYIPVPHRR